MRDPYKKATNNLTVSEQRELKQIEKWASIEFRNFWIRVFKRQGWTNVAIAKEMEITESTVRAILNK